MEPIVYIQLDGLGPRYAQLIRALKSAILESRLAAGARVPASRALAAELGISRNTVIAAYDQLQAEGFLVGRVGAGSFVAEIGTRIAPLRESGENALAAPLSQFAHRALALNDGTRIPGHQHRDLRYNLQYGLPLTNPALASAWRREISRAAERAEFDYPDAQGLAALREQICDYLARRRGVTARAANILVISGTQQAFALASRVLLEVGDTVVLEDPHYRGARQIFSTYGARVRGVRVDQEGLVPAALPARARLAVVTPSHQFPTGALLPLARRVELLEWAVAGKAWLIEDDYDGEFRFGGRPLAALKSLDHDGRVIYIGSYSKTLFPALRLGYMVLPDSLIDAFRAAKWLEDRGSNTLEQAALAHFMASGGFERHLRRAAQSLRARRSAMIEGLRKHAADAVEVVDSNAGMHLTAWLKSGNHADCERLAAHARMRGLGLYTIAPYSLQSPSRPGLLLGYAGLPPADIEAAMKQFGRCLRDTGLLG
ncbi:MAG: PLP-dependent aminotransferase family protein [Dokdonella sp.]|uniref:MocR-like pyridoxine biosynthesis transcription factor PdxR n=2 Tax=Dokdonella sp. TaxID=2291710 RepID=UPI002C032864|nr:PLP-dependent aminotransferase family protein [Dokdonella sp.]HQW76871.1 PLP-dependent aminotransferase family protein [Dokdonella sp.]HQX66416.1 PLP-dependent aminotransferase family protein [Dokdonella sp.]HQY54915.1 PLP-dependent aminotransferase family protein [Dokdonella sp.]HQZ61977.1 PLP-dependent aminotransferase family protein [Dokdonella sp.]